MDEGDSRWNWLLLLRTPGLRPSVLRAGLRDAGDPASLVERLRVAPPGSLRAAGRDWLRRPEQKRLAADLAWIEQPGHGLLCCDQVDFPPQLGGIDEPPAALFVRGNTGLLLRPQLAIVGARAASPAGLAHARHFSAMASAAGLLVTSGLADGIDGAAHEAALAAGHPTVAVIGTGADRSYPAKHRALSELIADHGAIVSEFPLGTPPRREHFPRRNRLIAGLTLGTLVIEASLRSGSLITAALAIEQGREVFALPGSIHNPLSQGCHRLIRDGAWLVEDPAELAQILAPAARELGLELAARLGQLTSTPRPIDPPATARLLASLGHDPVSVDELSRRMGEPIAKLAPLLLTLELEGRLAMLPGNRCQRLGS